MDEAFEECGQVSGPSASLLTGAADSLVVTAADCVYDTSFSSDLYLQQKLHNLDLRGNGGAVLTFFFKDHTETIGDVPWCYQFIAENEPFVSFEKLFRLQCMNKISKRGS